MRTGCASLQATRKTSSRAAGNLQVAFLIVAVLETGVQVPAWPTETRVYRKCVFGSGDRYALNDEMKTRYRITRTRFILYNAPTMFSLRPYLAIRPSLRQPAGCRSSFDNPCHTLRFMPAVVAPGFNQIQQALVLQPV
jgi:hypothetical protein